MPLSPWPRVEPRVLSTLRPRYALAGDGDDAEGEKKAKMRIYCALAMIKVRLLSKGCAAGTNFADV